MAESDDNSPQRKLGEKIPHPELSGSDGDGYRERWAIRFSMPDIVVEVDEVEQGMARYFYTMWVNDAAGKRLFDLPWSRWDPEETERDGRKIVRFGVPSGNMTPFITGGAFDYDPATRECALVDGPWLPLSEVDALCEQLKTFVDKSDSELEPEKILQWDKSDDTSETDNYTLDFKIEPFAVKVAETWDKSTPSDKKVYMRAVDARRDVIFHYPEGRWHITRVIKDGRTFIRHTRDAMRTTGSGGYVDFDPETNECRSEGGDWQAASGIVAMLTRLTDEASAAPGPDAQAVSASYSRSGHDDGEQWIERFGLPNVQIEFDRYETGMATNVTHQRAVNDQGTLLFSLPGGDWSSRESQRDGRRVIHFSRSGTATGMDYDPAARQCAITGGSWQPVEQAEALLNSLRDGVTPPAMPLAVGAAPPVRARKVWPLVLLGCFGGGVLTILVLLGLAALAG